MIVTTKQQAHMLTSLSNTNGAKLHMHLVQVLLDANCGAHLQLDYLQAADAVDPRHVPPLGMWHSSFLICLVRCVSLQQCSCHR